MDEPQGIVLVKVSHAEEGKLSGMTYVECKSHTRGRSGMVVPVSGVGEAGGHRPDCPR